MSHPESESNNDLAIERPLLNRIGSVIVLEWPTERIRATCRNIREHSDSLTSEITWTFWTGERWAVLYRSQMNMNSPQTRGTVSKALAERAKFGFNWRGAIDQLSILVPDEWRAGEPIVMLHEVDVPDEPPFLIERVLPENNTTVLYSDGQAGKSTVGLSLALAVANASTFAGRYRVRRNGPVLYLDWETSKEDHSFREHRLWASEMYGSERQHPVYYGRMSGPLADQVERLQEYVIERGIVLVVYDSLGWATGDELKDAGPAIRVMDAARAITGTALFLAHVTKDEAKKSQKGGGAATIFGSKYFELAARYTWEMTATQSELDGSKALVLRNRKANNVRRSDPISLRLEYEDPSGPIRLLDIAIENDLAGPASLPHRIEVALRKGALTTAELSTMTNASDTSIRQALNRMADKGVVRQVGTGGGRGNAARWGLAAPEYAGQEMSFVAPATAPAGATTTAQESAPEPAPGTAPQAIPDEEICAICKAVAGDRYLPTDPVPQFVCGPCGDAFLAAEAARATPPADDDQRAVSDP